MTGSLIYAEVLERCWNGPAFSQQSLAHPCGKSVKVDDRDRRKLVSATFAENPFARTLCGENMNLDSSSGVRRIALLQRERVQIAWSDQHDLPLVIRFGFDNPVFLDALKSIAKSWFQLFPISLDHQRHGFLRYERVHHPKSHHQTERRIEIVAKSGLRECRDVGRKSSLAKKPEPCRKSRLLVGMGFEQPPNKLLELRVAQLDYIGSRRQLWHQYPFKGVCGDVRCGVPKDRGWRQ